MKPRTTWIVAGCCFLAAVGAAAIPRTLLGERPGAAEALSVLALLLALALASAMLALHAMRRLRSLAGTLLLTCVAILPAVASGIQPKLPLAGQLWRDHEPARHLLTILALLVGWQLLLMFTRELHCRAERRAIKSIGERFAFDGRSTDWSRLVSHEEGQATLAGARVALVVKERSRPGFAGDAVLERADRDAAASQSDYGPLRAMVWALPALGFIGTAASMSKSISGIGSAVDSTSSSREQQRALVEVIPNLGDAFNITLLALATTVVCFLLLAIVAAREERVLNEVQALAMRALAAVETAWPPTPGVDPTEQLRTELWNLGLELARLRGPVKEFVDNQGSAWTISSLLYQTTLEMRDLNERSEEQAEAMRDLTSAMTKRARQVKEPA